MKTSDYTYLGKYINQMNLHGNKQIADTSIFSGPSYLFIHYTHIVNVSMPRLGYKVN